MTPYNRMQHSAAALAGLPCAWDCARRRHCERCGDEAARGYRLRAMNGGGNAATAGRGELAAAAIRTRRRRQPAARRNSCPSRASAAGSPDGGRRYGRRGDMRRRAASCATSTTGAAIPTRQAPRSGAALRAVQPRYRPAADAHVQRRRARRACASGSSRTWLGAAGAGQLHARRSSRGLPCHPDQGLPLRPRPAGRPRRLRGAADLLPRRDHRHRAPPRHPQGLHRLEGGAGAGVPAAVHPLQAQAVRGARAGGDAGAEDRSQEGRSHRASRHAQGCCRRSVSSDYVYIKLFKNMPRSDVEMVFPNTKVAFACSTRSSSASPPAAASAWAWSARQPRSRLLSNPYTLVMTLAGLGGVAARQASNFINQRNRYMVVMAQNLYFHSMADNRGVMTLLADRAADEDIKEEMLLYRALANEPAQHPRPRRPSMRRSRSTCKDLRHRCGLRRADALERLKQEGIVTELADGTLRCCRPGAGRAPHRQALGCLLDQLPDIATPARARRSRRADL